MGTPRKMTIGRVINILMDYYRYAEANKWIRKPWSYALHKTWIWCDKTEKERKAE